MNIAILTRACYPFHGLGGLERHVFDLVRHLIARDIAVTLVTPPDNAQADRSEAGADARRMLEGPRLVRRVVPYRTFPFAGRRGTTVLDRSTAYPHFGRRAGALAADLVSRGEIDLVYALGASALGYARARATGATAPLVLNPQGLEEFGATDPARAGGWLKKAAYAPLRAAVRECARAADCVIATDHVLEPVVRAHLDLPADRVRVVPNAIDVDACDRLAQPDAGRRLREAHGIGADEQVLLSVGRLQANKGFHVLADALTRLQHGAHEAGRSGGPGRWRWVLVGDGPFRPSIERAIGSAGLTSRVVLTGRATESDLHGWYEAASLFVHPTLYEGSSLVTLEAMAHRRAVVATTAGGLPDKVRPGVSGWLVPPGDAAALAVAIGEALEDPGRLAAMGVEGRQTAIATFSWPSVAGVFLQLCADLLREQAAARR